MTMNADDLPLPDPEPPRNRTPGRERDRPEEPEPRGLWLAVVRGVGYVLGLLPRRVAAGAALGWMLLIWWLSSGPIDARLPLPAADFFWNLAHAPVFGLLAALVATAAAPRPLPRDWPHPGRLAWLVALLVVAAWAASDEFHQARVGGRHGSPFDFATDLSGAAGVLWLATYAGRRGAHERGMRRRLLVAAGLCAAVAAVTTVADRLGMS